MSNLRHIVGGGDTSRSSLISEHRPRVHVKDQDSIKEKSPRGTSSGAEG